MSTEKKTATAGTGDTHGDGVLDAIDRAVADGVGDVDPDSLEGKLRMLVPGHAFFQREDKSVPDFISQLAERVGGVAVGPIGASRAGTLKVVWSTPTGVWFVKAHSHGRGSDTWHVTIDGPDTDLTREDMSVGQVIDLMRAVGAISAGS